MGDICPKCKGTNISGRYASFWVPLSKEGEDLEDFGSHESETELTDDRLCTDCHHSFTVGGCSEQPNTDSIDWAIKRCEALLEQGFTYLKIEAFKKDLENAKSYAK